MEALWGHRDRTGAKRVRKRVTSVGKVVVYAALAGTAFKTATGSRVERRRHRRDDRDG